MSCDKCRWFNKKGFASGFGDCVFYRFVCSSEHKVVCKHYEEYEQRPHGEWEALGFQQGYAFCRCSNCHKTMRLYRDSKNEFCCIADIRKKVVSCMYCGADMRRKSGEQNDG